MRTTELNSLRAKLAAANKKIVDLEKIIAIAHKDVATNIEDFCQMEQKYEELKKEADQAKKENLGYKAVVDSMDKRVTALSNENFKLKKEACSFEKNKAKMFLLSIADKIATQKMMRIMKNEYTHKAKARFANLFNEEIRTDVERMLSDLNYTVNDDLPF